MQKFFRYCDKHIKVILILPAAVILLGLFIYPFFYNLKISFEDITFMNIRTGKTNFVGLKNYLYVFKDLFIQQSVWRTLKFAVITVIIQLVLGLGMALAFNTDFKGKGMMMPFALSPMMITPVAVGLFWRILMNSRWGVLNYLLNAFGLKGLDWLSNSQTAFWSIIIVQVWWGVPFVFLIILGGLSALPKEPYESAELEGATTFQVFRFITLPLLRPVLTAVGVLRVIDALREFDIIYMLTGGGPGSSTRVFTLELYLAAFERGNYSVAAAMSIILLLLIFLLTVGMMKALQKSE